jgi:hypothetical protein
VFGPFGRPAHVAGSPAPAVGVTHQMLSIGKTLPIGQMLPIGKTLPIGQILPIGQMLPILPTPDICASPILPAPGICASTHDNKCLNIHQNKYQNMVCLNQFMQRENHFAHFTWRMIVIAIMPIKRRFPKRPLNMFSSSGLRELNSLNT